MTRTAKTYRKLPGKRLATLVTRSLWEGPDHLLWVEGNLMHEEYKRFYYQDIQALVLRRSSRRTTWTLVWGALALAFGALAWLVPGVPYVSLVFAVIFSLLLALNLLAGPSCEVYLQTAVQLERITTLVRVRKARKVLDRIKALAEEAQGALAPEALSQAAPAFAGAAASPLPLPRAKEEGAPYHPRLHLLLFGLLTSVGLVRAAQWWLRWVSLSVVDMLALAGTLVLAISALACWHRQVRGTAVGAAGWMALAYVILHGAAAYAFLFAATFQHPEAVHHHGILFKAFLELQTANHTPVKVYLFVNAAASLGLGVLGLDAVWEWKGRNGRPKESP